MARTAEQIDAELDAWQTQRTELTEALSGLTESLQSLRQELELDGGPARKAELSAQLERIETQRQELLAALAEAKTESASLRQELTELRANPPRPNPGVDPPGPPRNDPPPPRKTRAGIPFL